MSVNNWDKVYCLWIFTRVIYHLAQLLIRMVFSLHLHNLLDFTDAFSLIMLLEFFLGLKKSLFPFENCFSNFFPLLAFFFGLRNTDRAHILEWVFWKAIFACVLVLNLNSKIFTIIFAFLYGVRIDCPFAQFVYSILVIFIALHVHETCVDCKSANQLLILLVVDPEKEIS